MDRHLGNHCTYSGNKPTHQRENERLKGHRHLDAKLTREESPNVGTKDYQYERKHWVFQEEGMLGWQIMDFAMTKMKQLAHLAEEVAENGITPRFKVGEIDKSATIGTALKKALEDVRTAREEHLQFQGESETQKHAGLLMELDLALKQEEYEGAEIEDWSKKA